MLLILAIMQIIFACKKEDPSNETGTVTDSEGNTYQTIKIGTQWWMAENLNIGTMISSTEASDDDAVYEKYCYDDDEANCELYGGLYTWDEMMDYSQTAGSRGICPEGWHIPSDEDVKQLEIALGMPSSKADLDNSWRGSNEGEQLKTGGSSGFNMKMSGGKQSTATFFNVSTYGYFYTSTASGSNAWRRCVNTSSKQVGRYNTYTKNYALSVRCVKD